MPTAPDGLPLDTVQMFAEKAANFPPFEGEPFDRATALPGFEWPVVLFSAGRDTREPAFLHQKMSSELPDVLHIVRPDAAHNLLRFRTGVVLEIEQAAVRGGLRAASCVVPEAVADSPWHPQHVTARIVEEYLALAGAGTRTAPRQVAAVLVLVVLIVLLRRASRRRAAGKLRL